MTSKKHLTFRTTTRIARGAAILAATLVTAATLTGFTTTAAVASDYVLDLGKPVPGSTAGAVALNTDAPSSGNTVTPETSLPAAASYTVKTPTAPVKAPMTTQSIAGSEPATTAGEWSTLGDTGIAIAPASTPTSAGKTADATARASDPVQALSATVLDPATVTARGLSGLVLELKRTDSKTGSTPVAVRIPNALLDGLYGADYASRIRWVQIPTTTSTSAASAQPVSTTQDTANKAVVVTPTVGSSSMMLAAASSPTSSKGTGSFAATSLKSASSWDVSAQTGDFSWTYPMRTPPAAAGPSPSLELSYDSQSVDGETGASNNQPSTVGDGWSLGGGGFIEQSYVPCALDTGAAGPNTNSGDLCWKTDNATISLGGHSGQLVKDATTGTWKLRSDDGSRVEHLVGTAAGCAANGTYDTDCWRLTSRDGTQYYFGLNQLPGWAAGKATTNSAFTAPVYGNDPGEPCHAATFAASSCVQGWRWNLDYVVDTHHNAEALYYTAETNKYAQNGTGATSYIRGGQLDHIDYGLTSTSVYAANAASDKVVFSYDTYGRCNDTSHANCTAEPLGAGVTPAHPTAYPDIPFDQLCTGTSCPNQLSPTFWTTAQLATITTKVLKAGTYTNVDAWTLGHSFPDPGDLTNAALWLTQVSHTGYAGGATLTEPPTLFSGVTMQNRVNTVNGLAPLDKWRISSLTTSTGAVISVNYSAQECTPAGADAIEAAPESNHKRCFPQWWTPQITPPVAATIDLFHKYVVTSVISNPKTGGGNDQTQQTSYLYTGTPAWRYDNSPLTIEKQHTWSQYAGYDTVEVRVGSDPATAQTTDYTFYQGMDGDRATSTGGTKTVKVNGTTTVADSLWFAGTVRETKVLNGAGGAVVSDTTTTPWASGVTANDNTRTARLTGTTEVVETEPVTTGGNRTTDTTTTNDGTYGLPLNVNVATSDAGTTCTTYTYAAANTSAWLIGLPSETAKVGVNCANVSSAVYPKDAISDARVIYDAQAQGAAATIGDVTTTRTVDSYTGATANTAHWIDASINAYDAYGRTTSVKDVLGHTTSTAYTPAATATAGSGPLTSTTSTNPLGWTSATDVDPAWGAETKAIDQNGNVTTATYDALGRRVGVWLPTWAQADNPSEPSTGYTYTLSQTGPNAVSTKTSVGGQAVLSYVLFDGLGQQIQTQGPADSNGMTVADTLYDSAGRNYMTNNTYWTTSAAPSASLFVPQSEQNIGSEILTNYDGAGRVLSAVTNSYLVEQYRTTNTYPGADKTDTVPPSGGIPTSNFTNSLGQQTKLTQWLSATTTGTSQSTTYSYNPSGAMTNMTDPAGNQWTWAYDVLGHETQAVDPDTGTTNSTYDSAGNVQTTTDARGVVVAYTYDTLNRKTGKYQNAAGTAGSLLDKWDWDSAANGKGLLAKSSSYTGSVNSTPGIAYTDTITGYDGLNNPTGHTISIPTGAPAFGGTTYTTGLHYYPDGAYYATEYPTIGGLAAENVFYSYNGAGHLTDVGVTNTSYASVTYTPIGQVAQISHFGLGITENTAYGYNVANGETQNIRDMTTAGGVVTDQAYRRYSHDNAGNVTSVSTSGTAATDTQCYTYDKLRELTAAWTPTSNSCTNAPTASTIGGPAPFWKSYTFDAATGNRTQTTTNPITATGATSTSVYSYSAATAPHPHAAKAVATTASGATTTSTYGYDASGNTTTRPGQTLTYDPNGKLATVVASTSTQNNVYDATGNLLLQKDPTNGSTLYLGDTQFHQAAGSTTLSTVRTYTLNGTPVAERDSAAGATNSVLYYLGADIDKTSDLEVNAVTGAVTHRYQDPYGNVRGTPAIWSSPNGYLNAPKSTFSGLTNIGARSYDSVLGKFISVDAVLTPTDPAQNNGYGYAGNSPISNTDPSGNCFTQNDYICPGKAPTNSSVNTGPNNNHGGGGGTPPAAGSSKGNHGSGGQRSSSASNKLSQFKPVIHAISMPTADQYAAAAQQMACAVASQYGSVGACNSDEAAASDHQVASLLDGAADLSAGFFTTCMAVPDASEACGGFSSAAAVESAAARALDSAIGQSQTSAILLARKLASEEQFGKMSSGSVATKVLAGRGSAEALDTVDRLTATYGGTADDWVKLTTKNFRGPDGYDIQTHWYENLSNPGVQYEKKSKFGWAGR